MSGSWIKWVKGLATKREVLIMSAELKLDRHEVAGRLMTLWEWCDDNLSSKDVDNNGNAKVTLGSLPEITIDAVTGVSGFAAAMSNAGWLKTVQGNAVFPNFGRHNGETAKTRALTASRVAKHKAHGNANANARGVSVTVRRALPKEDKSISETETETETESQPGRTKNPGTHEPPDINTLRCVPITAIPIGRVNPSAVFDVLTPEMLANPSQVISWFRRQLNAASPVLEGNYADLLLAVCASRRASGRGIKQPVGSFVSLVTKRNWRGVIRYRKEAEAAIAAVLASDLPTKPSETGCAT